MEGEVRPWCFWSGPNTVAWRVYVVRNWIDDLEIREPRQNGERKGDKTD